MPLANRIERRRLFLPIIALMVLPILLVWGAVVYKATTEEEMVIKAVYTENLNLARAFEEHTIRTIKSVDQAVLFLKFQYERYGDKVNIAEYVREGMIISNIFNQLGVIDENGIYILSNLPNHKQMDLSDREHFRVHKEKDTNQLFISKPILGRASGKWSIQMTRRINKPDGSFGGVVVISVDPFYFSDFYRSVELGSGGVVSLVGLDGITRARRAGDNMTVGQNLSQSALLRVIHDKPIGSLRATSTSDGLDRLYSYRTLTEYPLIVAVGVTEESALREFRSRRFGYQVFAFATTLIVLLFGTIAMRLLDRQYRITAELRESQIRAESANRMKSEFLASMSHELRTPLNGIMGYAELLRESTTGENQEFAGVILDSSEHLLDLVNSILDLAKIESGKTELVMRPEPLRTLIDKIVRTYQPPAAKKGLELAVTLTDDLPADFVCDATRVVQVLNNLLSNAIKFTDHGRVEVRVSRVGDELEFVVADSGCGIAPDMLSHVFERFSQADNFLTRRHQGTGLGLALVKELVDLMGGSVNVRSELEKGSEFIVRLPLGD
ncbi:hybrid sensor histidine kinase/response regulator [uncultured Zoogloea sp.]|uniref:sensor histidine kinase n=1 Tax=uncultured Zoogloea sp. TaxID=160237 RepID=UPI0026225A62|nr:hybrid sensor histidine kinase/response regulator [uncultured Zoogloea sp.]